MRDHFDPSIINAWGNRQSSLHFFWRLQPNVTHEISSALNAIVTSKVRLKLLASRTA
jgi:hypothetical protein